jgi:hypothetical protein
LVPTSFMLDASGGAPITCCAWPAVSENKLEITTANPIRLFILHPLHRASISIADVTLSLT